MFYVPGARPASLAHDPFNALVAPRPIGWIASRDRAGRDNLAPYSFFNAVAYTPPQVMFASTSAKPDRGDTKDSVANIRETGVFCVNLVSWPLRQAMNETSAPHPRDIDEFAVAGIAKEACETISCARVAEAPAALECRMTQIVRLAGPANFVVFGEVVGVHLSPGILRAGVVDPALYQPIGRLGASDYVRVSEVFSMARPG